MRSSVLLFSNLTFEILVHDRKVSKCNLNTRAGVLFKGKRILNKDTISGNSRLHASNAMEDEDENPRIFYPAEIYLVGKGGGNLKL